MMFRLMVTLTAALMCIGQICFAEQPGKREAAKAASLNGKCVENCDSNEAKPKRESKSSAKAVRLHGLCVAGCGPSDPRPQRAFPPRNLTFREVYESLEDCTLLLVDVRNRSEFYRDPGHIPGSFNIPLPELEEAFDETKTNDKNFYIQHGFDRPKRPGIGMSVTCLLGIRAGKAIEILAKLGYTDVNLYSEAITGWAASGGRYCRYGPLPSLPSANTPKAKTTNTPYTRKDKTVNYGYW